MSAEERQAKTADLSSRVKELMNAGQYDEALDLLTEGLTEEQKQEIIDALLGDSDERRKFDLRERRKRMEERIRNGQRLIILSCQLLSFFQHENLRGAKLRATAHKLF